MTAALIAVSLSAGILPGGSGAPCLLGVAGAATAKFVAPVAGPIVRRFEAPLGPYAAGHRGIDFDVVPGSEVVASSDGIVAFAGPVADDGMFVTIRHDDVIETTYSFLSEVSVAAGDEVHRGDAIALSGDGHPGGPAVLHFGAKAGGNYFDPEVLLFGNLDDISDLISLGPLDDNSGFENGGALGGSSTLAQAKDLKGAHLPWPARLGAMLAGAGRGLVGAAVSAGRWIGARAKGAVRFLESVSLDLARNIVATAHGVRGLIGRAGQLIGGAVRGIGSGVRAVGRGVAAAVRSVVRAIDAVNNALAATYRALGETIRAVSAAIRQAIIWTGEITAVLGRAAKVLGGWFSGSVTRVAQRAFRSLFHGLVSTKDAFVVVGALAKGAYDQYQCSKKGGATPPRIPSKEEFERGMAPPAPPNDNIIVAVAGIGSHTAGRGGEIAPAASMYEMDFRTLGYSEDQVFYFSYRGIEDRGGAGPYRLHAPYTKEDTYQSLREAASVLALQVEAIHARYPSKRIDLVAHSQGGLVAQYFLTFLRDVDSPEGIEVDHLVTLATPHQGADAAALGPALSDTPQGRNALAELDEFVGAYGLPEPGSASAREMAEGSGFITELNERWDPDKVKATSIAATYDFVVTPQHTRLSGAAQYTVDMPNQKSSWLAHGNIVHSPDAKTVLYDALADTPAACTAWRNAFADYGPGRIISGIEDGLIRDYDLVTELVPAGPSP